jgi:CubicO group peptidase (beta-lactamase class C family)
MDSNATRRRILAGLAGLGAFSAAGATAAPGDRFPAVKALLQRYIAEKKLSGGVMAVLKRGGPVDMVSEGTLAFDTDAPMGPTSLFRVYSMTKPIIGVATMILIEQGKLSLDQPLADILPAFSHMNVLVDGDVSKTRPAARPILIRHLITHTSGLSYHINQGPLPALYRKNGLRPGDRNKEARPGELPPPKDLKEFGARLAALPLESDPGTKWQYSFGADLMGLVIQTVSGMPLYDFLRTRIFEPLGMPDTDFVVPVSKVARLTTVYSKTPTGVVDSDDRKSSPFGRDRDLPSGGGGLVSTARDYMQFCGMLLNEGAFGGRRILKPETVRIARSNLMPPGPVFDMLRKPNGFGALMQVILPGGELPGGEPAGSYGWSGAAGTTMWIDPVNQIAAVLMVQFMPAGAYPIYLEARTAAYGDLRIMGRL